MHLLCPPTPTLDQSVNRAIYFSPGVNVSDAGAQRGGFSAFTLAHVRPFRSAVETQARQASAQQGGERSLTNFNRFAPQIWAGAALLMKSLEVGTIFNPPIEGCIKSCALGSMQSNNKKKTHAAFSVGKPGRET